MHISKAIIALGLGGILCLFSSTLYSAPASYVKSRYCRPLHWYLDLGVGKSYDYAHSNSTLLGADTRFSTTASYSTPFFLAGMGYLWSQDYHAWLPKVNVGLQHRYTSPVNVFGLTDRDSLPNYNYRVQQESWLIMTKADIYKWQKLMPYAALGLGVSFNRISQFFVNGELIDQFTSPKTLTGDFSYSLGAGIDYAIKDDLWLSLGYFYDDFGKNKADPILNANGLPFSSFKNATLHANSVFLSIRYLFV